MDEVEYDLRLKIINMVLNLRPDIMEPVRGNMEDL